MPDHRDFGAEQHNHHLHIAASREWDRVLDQVDGEDWDVDEIAPFLTPLREGTFSEAYNAIRDHERFWAQAAKIFTPSELQVMRENFQK